MHEARIGHYFFSHYEARIGHYEARIGHYLVTKAGSPQQHEPITVGLVLPIPPCQLSLREETGVPGENPRLSAER